MSDKNRSKPMQYGEAFQREVIHLMLTDPIFCGKAVDQLQPGDFAKEFSWFFSTIASYEGKVPSRGSLDADICKHSVEKQEEYFKELERIFSTVPNPEKINEEMTQFIRANIFVDGCMEAVGLFNAPNKKDEAYAVINKKLEALNRTNFGHDGNTRFGTWRDVIANSNIEHANAIRTGLHEIDAALGGGLLPGTWTTFLGSSNAGKSMIMANLAKQAALQGKRVFVTVHEDEETPTKLRYLACFAEVEYNRLAYGYTLLTPEEIARIDKADALLKEKVVLRFMYTDKSSVENVMMKARNLMRDWDGTPDHLAGGFDLFLCDYGQCLTSSDFKKLDSVRHLQEHVYHLLKQLCLELKIPGAGGAQVNREGNKMNSKGLDWLRMTDVAEAFGIAKKSSNVITINRSTQDVQNNRVVYLLDKSRNGRCPVAVEVESNYAMAITYKTDPLKQSDVTNVIEVGPSKQNQSDANQAKKDMPRPVSAVEDIRYSKGEKV